MAVLTTLALLAASHLAGPLLAAAFRPMASIAAQCLQVDSLQQIDLNQQAVFQLMARTGEHCWVGARQLPAGIELNASTLLAHALLHPVLLATTLAAWPGFNVRERLRALPLAVVALILSEALDVPMVLAGSLWDLLYANLAPGHSSSLIGWMNVLNGGGRLALPCAGAVAALLLGCRRPEGLMAQNTGERARGSAGTE